jgi:hypothetical protein
LVLDQQFFAESWFVFEVKQYVEVRVSFPFEDTLRLEIFGDIVTESHALILKFLNLTVNY